MKKTNKLVQVLENEDRFFIDNGNLFYEHKYSAPGTTLELHVYTAPGGSYPRVVIPGIGNLRLHRVIALLKFGDECFKPGIVCRHYPDPDPGNCSWDNIQIGTDADNNSDRLEDYGFHYTKKRWMHKLRL